MWDKFPNTCKAPLPRRRPQLLWLFNRSLFSFLLLPLPLLPSCPPPPPSPSPSSSQDSIFIKWKYLCSESLLFWREKFISSVNISTTSNSIDNSVSSNISTSTSNSSSSNISTSTSNSSNKVMLCYFERNLLSIVAELSLLVLNAPTNLVIMIQ